MVFVPAPGTIKAELVYLWENSYMENVLNYDVGESVAFSDLDGCAAALLDCWNSHLKSTMCSALQLVKIRCTSLDSQDAPGIERVTGLPSGATHNGTPLPANCAAEMILYTDLRGRSNRGRLFIPALEEGGATGSVWEAETKSIIQGQWQNVLHLETEGFTGDLTVVSRFHNGARRAIAETNAVTRLFFAPYVVSQRRRLPGRGG